MTVSPEFLMQQRIKKMIAKAQSRPPNPWSEARNRMLTQPGRLYAAQSKGGNWIKVGFSLNVERRMGEINRRFPALAPFKLLGSTVATYEVERQIHRILAPFRFSCVGLSRELYLAFPKVVEVATGIVAWPERQRLPFDEYLECARWARACTSKTEMYSHVREIYRAAYKSGYREFA